MASCVHVLEDKWLRCQYCLNEYLFKAISIKFQHLFTYIEEVIIKFTWKWKQPQNSQNELETIQIRGLTLLMCPQYVKNFYIKKIKITAFFKWDRDLKILPQRKYMDGNKHMRKSSLVLQKLQLSASNETPMFTYWNS